MVFTGCKENEAVKIMKGGGAEQANQSHSNNNNTYIFTLFHWGVNNHFDKTHEYHCLSGTNRKIYMQWMMEESREIIRWYEMKFKNEKKIILFVPILIFILLINPATAFLEISSPGNNEIVGGRIDVITSWSSTEAPSIQHLHVTATYYNTNGDAIVGTIGYAVIPSNSLSHTFSWDTSSYPNGIPITIRATTDYAGNPAKTIYVNNPYPTVIFSSPSEGANIYQGTILPVTVECNRLDPNYNGIRWYSLLAQNNGVLGITISPAVPSYSNTWNIDTTPYLGEYQFQAYCEDTSGKGTYSIRKINIISPQSQGNSIPEFPTVALPVIAVICLMFLFQRRKSA